MGGTVFTKPSSPNNSPLSVPRMPPATYQAVKQHAHTALGTLFAHVSTPPEAPGKPDHGDADFHVNDSTAILDAQAPALAAALCAVRTHPRGPGSFSFAVPWPPGHSEKDAYAQIDVAQCASLAEQTWITWLHGYGDTTQILARALRPHGLVFHPRTGLMLRDPALAALDHSSPVGETPSRRSQSDLALSDEPDKVMAFLGLDVPRYNQGFESEGALFAWLAGSPFVRREAFAAAADEGSTTETHTKPDPPTNARTRVSDRRRRDTRQMYVRFIDEFLPAQPQPAQPVQADVVGAALGFFERRGEYEAKVAGVQAAQAENAFWNAVKERIPKEKASLREALRGLKRFVRVTDAEQGGRRLMIADEPVSEEQQLRTWTGVAGFPQEYLLDWVDANWEECKAREKQRARREADLRRAAKDTIA